MKVGIIDYGLGNLRSVINAFSCFQVDVLVMDKGSDLYKADKLVLPGVGAFDAGMKGLNDRGHIEPLNKLVLEGGVPFLGLCLGMQLIFQESEEGEKGGLGWLKGPIRRFRDMGPEFKLPHMGWNEAVIRKSSGLWEGLEAPLDFYFVHNFYAPVSEIDEINVVASVEHGITFAAAVEKDNIAAVQFHPEKSQLCGMKLLENFVSSKW